MLVCLMQLFFDSIHYANSDWVAGVSEYHIQSHNEKFIGEFKQATYLFYYLPFPQFNVVVRA